MLITDSIVYLELQKTGCSHTRRILADVYGDTCTLIGKHNAYYEVPKTVLGNFESKVKIGNVRNPWDWYVSLWAFGCQQGGGLHTRLTTQKDLKATSKKGIKHLAKRSLGLEYRRLDKEIWKKLYSDPTNYDNFNNWLSLILSEEKHDIGERYKATKLSQYAGLLTYRYLKLYTYKNRFDAIGSQEELREYDEAQNFMDVMIRNESLHEDLLEASVALGFNEEELAEILKGYQDKTNTSSRDSDYRKYYSDISVALVENKEKLIIDKHGYRFG